MGAWGYLTFQNDDALDWVYGLERVTDLSLVERTFTKVDRSEDYLEAPPACEALAACEVLARLLGHPGYQDASTKTVDDWVKQNPKKPSVELLARAERVIDRILARKSELRDLWEEGDGTIWLKTVENLRSRLRP